MNRAHAASMTGLLMLCMLVTSCGGNAPSENDSPDDSTGNTTQIANPASQHCIDQGGTLDVVDESGGQVGYCVLPDGSRIEEWEYFRSSGG